MQKLSLNRALILGAKFKGESKSSIIKINNILVQYLNNILVKYLNKWKLMQKIVINKKNRDSGERQDHYYWFFLLSKAPIWLGKTLLLILSLFKNLILIFCSSCILCIYFLFKNIALKYLLFWLLRWGFFNASLNFVSKASASLALPNLHTAG